MPKFSGAFGINKSQSELDFVDIPLHTDVWLFIDPFAIGQRVDPWSRKCHATLVAFFQRVVDYIRAGRLDEARNLLAHLREPSEIRESEGPLAAVGDDDERVIAEALGTALRSIPTGSATATQYHRLMIGVLEFLFFPALLNPKKKTKIHQGRKRIDILTENGARDGIFHRLHEVRHLPCAFVPIECKNYTTEVANPELDQLAGRFSVNRGQFGFLCCRSFENHALFVERCRDTHNDARGLIVPLDDNAILQLLELVRLGQRNEIDRNLTERVNEVWVS